MTLSIIIVNYNSFALTSNCIKSVITFTRNLDHEIILVDNASSECAPELFKKDFPQLILVKNDKNGGFAAGNNLGLEKASGDHILLLNSDTLLTENSLQKCLELIKVKKQIGVMGCRMVFPDGKVQYSARRFRSISWELLDLFRFIPFLMPYQQRSKRMLGKYFRHDGDIEADWVNGAFFMFPRKVLDQMPGKKLDDRFFMYGEDQLWCEQVRKMGYTIYFFAATTIIHINSGSTVPDKQMKLRKTMMKHELEIMRMRKGKGLYYILFKMIFVAKESTRNLVKSIVFKLSGRLIR